MTQEKVIKIGSKQTTCSNNIQTISLRSTKRLVTKRGNEIQVKNDDQSIDLSFNLQLTNLTKLNFKHDNIIINSINIAKQLANISSLEEKEGYFHTYENENSEIRNKIGTLVEDIYEEVMTIIQSRLRNILMIIGVILVGVMIIKCYIRRRNTY